VTATAQLRTYSIALGIGTGTLLNDRDDAPISVGIVRVAPNTKGMTTISEPARIAFLYGAFAGGGRSSLTLRPPRPIQFLAGRGTANSLVVLGKDNEESPVSRIFELHHACDPLSMRKPVPAVDAKLLIQAYEKVGADRELFGSADLPLNFHPVAIRVSADVTPFGAVSVPA
jgi:hypothetical protein